MLAGTPVPLRSARKVEKADDERSMRVKSAKRVFSAVNSSFFILSSSASCDLAAISPSSCPMYSVRMLADSLTF